MLNSPRPSDTYASVNKAIIGSDNGLPPVRRQAIIWTNAGILIGSLETHFGEIWIEIWYILLKMPAIFIREKLKLKETWEKEADHLCAVKLIMLTPNSFSKHKTAVARTIIL